MKTYLPSILDLLAMVATLATAATFFATRHFAINAIAGSDTSLVQMGLFRTVICLTGAAVILLRGQPWCSSAPSLGGVKGLIIKI